MTPQRSKHVWIVQTGESLPLDGEVERPMRATSLATELVRRGHRVTIISSDFWHQRKKHRYGTLTRVRLTESLDVLLVPSPGYLSHIGLKRLHDHRVLAARFREIAPREKPPDILVVGFPPIEIADEAVQLARRWRKPVILDIKDQWPDLFWQRLPLALQGLGRLALHPLLTRAVSTFRAADGITSMSDPFLQWSLCRAGRGRSGFDGVFPLGCQRQAPLDVSTPSASRDVVFIGSLTRSFDFDTLIGGFRKSALARRGGKLVLCGTGDGEDRLKRYASLDSRIELRGWIDREGIRQVMGQALMGTAPYVQRGDFEMSLPNKVIEYASFAVPILSPKLGEMHRLVSATGCGATYSPGSVSSCSAAIDSIADMAPSALVRTRTSLLRYFSEQLEATSVYGRFADLVEQMSDGVPLVR